MICPRLVSDVMVTCEPGDGPPWTDWADLTEADTGGWRMVNTAQPRPGPPGSEASTLLPVAGVQPEPPHGISSLHPAHGNTDTHWPLIGQ